MNVRGIRQVRKDVNLSMLMNKITERLSFVSRVSLFIIFILMSCDVISTKIFNWSIIGTKAYVEALMIFVVFFTVPFVTAEKSHIFVDIIKYPPKIKGVLDIIHFFLGFLLAGVFTWRTIVFVLQSKQSGSVMTGTEGWMNLPIWPIALVLVFGFAATTFLYIVQLIKAFGLVGKKGYSPID